MANDRTNENGIDKADLQALWADVKDWFKQAYADAKEWVVQAYHDSADWVEKTWGRIKEAWGTLVDYVKANPDDAKILGAILAGIILVIIIIACASASKKRKRHAAALRAARGEAGDDKPAKKSENRDYFLEGEYEEYLKKQAAAKEAQEQGKLAAENRIVYAAPVAAAAAVTAVEAAKAETVEQPAPIAEPTVQPAVKPTPVVQPAAEPEHAEPEVTPIAAPTPAEETAEPVETPIASPVAASTLTEPEWVDEPEPETDEPIDDEPIDEPELANFAKPEEEKYEPIIVEKIEIVKQAPVKKFGPDNLNTTRSGKTFTEEELRSTIK